ncbi:MAG: hypothetical protein O3A00_02785 [Planctomycetota bacterium]|nr:hypothetical protein [Planctomycetota bacterium]
MSEHSTKAAWIGLLVAFGCVLNVASGVRAADAKLAPKLADDLRKLDGRVILRGTLARQPLAAMLSRYIDAELRAANRRDRSEWNAIKTKADWERMRDVRIKGLRDSLGRFPAPQDVVAHVVRTTTGDGFAVDNVVYESRPGMFVTANLYRPAEPSKSMPGIVVCHSHQRPKENGARQLMGATWARAGCVVLVPDHLGHGERRQHPFVTESDFDKPFRVSSQDYYFRYDAGIQLHLIGDSLMGWLAWDLSRGVDVLLQQAGVDSQRIVMISEPAGGGDVAAVTTALDDRITGVMVNNFGGPEPENGYPLPQDAESWFPYTASGSWESTRNLRLSARDGFVPWSMVASVAPRRLIYYHEFYWDRVRDPVWKRLRTIYGFYDAADSVVGLAGHGFVVGSSPENTHWTPESRELLYPTLKRWFAINNPQREYGKLLPEAQLQCLTTSKGKDFKSVPLHRLCSELGAERTSAAQRELDRLSAADRRSRLRTSWAERLGDVDVAAAPNVLKRELGTLGDVAIERIQIATEPGIIVPVLLLHSKGGSRRVVIGVAQSGKQHFLEQRSGQIAELLEAGTTVCLLDVRGTGETDPGDGRGRYSTITTLSSNELMLGQTLVAARLRDLRQVIRYLRGRDDVNPKRIVLWGDSFAPTNAADTNFAVPRRVDSRPHQSEPLGGLLVMLCALFDEQIEAVSVSGGLTGFRDVLASPYCYVPHDIVIPRVLTTGDLSDVAAAIAPRPLRLNGLVDGLNRRVADQPIRNTYERAVKAYEQASAGHRLGITSNGVSIATWLKQLRLSD